MDGFIISHCIQSMHLEKDEAVRDFIGEYASRNPLLDIDHPVTWGALDLQDYYIEHKRGQHQAMKNAHDVIRSVSKEFGERFGRSYDLFESYRLEDAERVIVAINSVCGEVKEVVDELRDRGEKVGLLKIRVFRPFPYAEIRQALSGAGIVTVLDRVDSFGAYGPLFKEIQAAMYAAEDRPLMSNRVYGLGGRDLMPQDIHNLFEESGRDLEAGRVENLHDYLCVRGE